MTAPYVPPCRCEVPDDIDDPGAHLPNCPHFDPAHDPAADAPLSERSVAAAIQETRIDVDRLVRRVQRLVTSRRSG